MLCFRFSWAYHQDGNKACLYIYHKGHIKSEPFILDAEEELTDHRGEPYMGVENIKNATV